MKATDLREVFDAAFARRPEEKAAAEEQLLAIRIAGEPHVLRLSEIAGIFADRAITPVPSRSRLLLGIAGVRGSVVPVFDLAAIVGRPASSAKPRWLVIAGAQRVGFAFDGFDGHLAVPASAIARETSGTAHILEVARTGDLLRPIVRLDSVIAVLERKEA